MKKLFFLYGLAILFALFGCTADLPEIDMSKQESEEQNEYTPATRGLTGIDGQFYESKGGGVLGAPSEDVLFINTSYHFSYLPPTESQIKAERNSASNFYTSIGVRKVLNNNVFNLIWNPQNYLSGATGISMDHIFTEPGEYEVKGNVSYLYSSGALTRDGEYFKSKRYTVVSLIGGTIAPSIQTIDYGATPTRLTSTAPAVSAAGSTITYRWQWTTNNGASWTIISNSNSLSYQPGALTQTTKYRRQAIAGDQTVNSNEVTVTVYPQLLVGIVSPSLQTIASGSRPTILTCGTPQGGNGSYSYQWQTLSGGSWVNITNARSSTYQPPVLTGSGSSYLYRAKVTSGSQTAYPRAATIEIRNDVPGGNIFPLTQTVRAGVTPAQLTGSIADYISNTGYTFQWETSVNGTNWSNISGETGWFYQPASTYSRGTTYYRRKVMLNNLFAYSNTVTVIVN